MGRGRDIRKGKETTCQFIKDSNGELMSGEEVRTKRKEYFEDLTEFEDDWEVELCCLAMDMRSERKKKNVDNISQEDVSKA